jgi:hypothetical protein
MWVILFHAYKIIIWSWIFKNMHWLDCLFRWICIAHHPYFLPQLRNLKLYPMEHMQGKPSSKWVPHLIMSWYYTIFIPLVNIFIIKNTCWWLLNMCNHCFQSFLMLIHIHISIIQSFSNITIVFTCPLCQVIFLPFKIMWHVLHS